MTGERIMDYLQEAIYKKIATSPIVPDLQIVHCHPTTIYKLTQYLHMNYINTPPIDLTKKDAEANFFGVKCKFNANRYMLEDEFKVSDDLLINVIHDRMTSREYMHFEPSSRNLEWKHKVSMKVSEKVEVINADCFWELTPPEELLENMERKLQDRVNFLTAKNVPIRLFRTNDSLIIAVDEDHMYSYFFSEGVNEKTLKKATDYAKEKLKEKINKIFKKY